MTWQNIEKFYFSKIFKLSCVRELQVEPPQKQEIRVKNILIGTHSVLLHQLYCKQ